GIRVNALAPGYVETGMTTLIFGDEGMRQAFAREHATGLQTPEEIADLAVFLVSDEARSLTGAVLTCDRGWSAFKRPAALAPCAAAGSSRPSSARRPRAPDTARSPWRCRRPPRASR